jgi:hypothetical protein
MCRCGTPQLQCISVAWAPWKLYLRRSCQEIRHDDEPTTRILEERDELHDGAQAAGAAQQDYASRPRH